MSYPRGVSNAKVHRSDLQIGITKSWNCGTIYCRYMGADSDRLTPRVTPPCPPNHDHPPQSDNRAPRAHRAGCAEPIPAPVDPEHRPLCRSVSLPGSRSHRTQRMSACLCATHERPEPISTTGQATPRSFSWTPTTALARAYFCSPCTTATGQRVSVSAQEVWGELSLLVHCSIAVSDDPSTLSLTRKQCLAQPRPCIFCTREISGSRRKCWLLRFWRRSTVGHRLSLHPRVRAPRGDRCTDTNVSPSRKCIQYRIRARGLRQHA